MRSRGSTTPEIAEKKAAGSLMLKLRDRVEFASLGFCESQAENPQARWARTCESRLRELHPYEVPEIVALKPEQVADGYARWVGGVFRNRLFPDPARRGIRATSSKC